MWSAAEKRDVLSFSISLTYSLFSFPAVQSKVRGCNRVQNRTSICSAQHTAETCTPRNASTPSDALCIKITHAQPCILSPFMFMWMQDPGSSRWQLNSRGAPPLCWGPCLAGLTDGDQTGESGVGTLGARSGFWVLWKDLSSPFRADRVSHVLH